MPPPSYLTPSHLPILPNPKKFVSLPTLNYAFQVMIKKTKLSWALQPVMNNRRSVVRSRAPQAVAAAVAEPKQEEAEKPAAPNKETAKSKTNKK